MVKSIQGQTALALMLFSISSHAVDFRNPHEMVQNIEREIQERNDRNREKFEDLKHRANEQLLLDELREQRRQYEIDRMIDESNR